MLNNTMSNKKEKNFAGFLDYITGSFDNNISCDLKK